MWILCAILFIAAGGYALRPLFEKTFDESAWPEAETATDYLVGRKTAVYHTIRELEFEYKMGRLTESDFERLESEYKGEAAEILEKLDTLNDPSVRSESEPDAEPKPDAETGACPACGAKTITGKNFCADCGARL